MTDKLETEAKPENDTPPWPTEIVEELKAGLLEELNREHDGPCQGIGTMSDLARVMMGLVEPYEYDNPAVAYHAEKIYALLYELAGVKRR